MQSPPPNYVYPPQNTGIPTYAKVLLGCGCLAIFGFIPILAAIVLPVFSQSRVKARQISCLSNLKQLGLGTVMYLQDYDETLPPVKGWNETIYPYIKNERLYSCPAVAAGKSGISGYAFNSALSKQRLKNIMAPQDTGLLYDSSNLKLGAFDAITSLPAPGRHSNGNNIAYVDGHAKWSREDAPKPLTK